MVVLEFESVYPIVWLKAFCANSELVGCLNVAEMKVNVSNQEEQFKQYFGCVGFGMLTCLIDNFQINKSVYCPL